MLKALQLTNVMDFKPDVEGVDVWADTYSWNLIPDSPGVYCFYDADTMKILYIGSACARSSVRHSRGLAMRLQFYRSNGIRNKSPSVRKILEARKSHRILVRCWEAHSASDARKYEYDAIEKWKPELNCEMAIEIRSIEQMRKSRCVSARKKQLEYKAIPDKERPAENQTKTCKGCGKTKTMKEFYWNRCKKDGRSATCKKCRSQESKNRNRRYASLNTSRKHNEDADRFCKKCNTMKKARDFHKRVTAKDGLQRYCKECNKLSRSYRPTQVAHRAKVRRPRSLARRLSAKQSF